MSSENQNATAGPSRKPSTVAEVQTRLTAVVDDLISTANVEASAPESLPSHDPSILLRSACDILSVGVAGLRSRQLAYEAARASLATENQSLRSTIEIKDTELTTQAAALAARDRRIEELEEEVERLSGVELSLKTIQTAHTTLSTTVERQNSELVKLRTELDTAKETIKKLVADNESVHQSHIEKLEGFLEEAKAQAKAKP